MVNSTKSIADRPVYLYLPFVDEQGTGMQRFGSEMILALLRSGIDARVIIGDVQGRPNWLLNIPHKVINGGLFGRILPRAVTALARLLWVQFVLPMVAERGATLLTLADRDLAIVPLMRQVAVAHDLTQATNLRQRGGVARNLRIRLWKTGLRRSAAVIAISGATKSDLVERFNIPAERICVVYEGYDPAVFRPAPAETRQARPYLLYAGTLAPNKNIPFLLDVYSRLRERHNLDLKLVGKQDPASVAGLLQLVPAELRSGVHFDGFVTDAQLASLMQGCTAFVFPSLYEGFGLAPVEAMACGAPVVSSDATSLKEVVGAGGVLLSPTDVAAWVVEIDRVVGDADYRGELARRALIRSNDFSWDNAARAYKSLLAADPGVRVSD